MITERGLNMSEIKDMGKFSEQEKIEEGLKRLNGSLEKNSAKKEVLPSEVSSKSEEFKAEIMNELNKGAKETRDQNGDVSFDGNYESQMREVKKHQDAYLKYEQEANKLESDIRRGKEPKARMSEVNRLRRKSETEKREMEKEKELAKRALMSFKGRETSKADTVETDERKSNDLFFTGGFNGPCGRACLKSGVRVGFHSGG